MSADVVFQQMVIIFLMIGIGYFLYRKRILRQESSRDFSALITTVCNPAILIASGLDRSNTASRKDLLLVIGIAVLVFFVLIICGIVLPRFLHASETEKKFYNLLSVYGNMGFIGIPVASAVLGSSSLIYVAVFNLIYCLLIYTHGIFVLEYKTGDGSGSGEKASRDWRGLLRKIFNVGTVSGIITILLFWFQISVPVVLSDTINYAGRCTTFLSMVVLGASLSQIRLRDIFNIPKLYLFIALRYILIPVAVGILLKLFFGNGMIVEVSILMMAMPAGNMPMMLAKQRNMECDMMAKGILLSTALSLVTIPIVTYFATL